MDLDIRGSSRLSALIYILIAIVVIYVAVKTVRPYMKYYSMDDEVATQLHLSTINSEEMILDDLAAKASELEIPVSRQDIKLTRDDNGHVSIRIKWVATVDYGYGFKRDFPFEITSGDSRKEDAKPTEAGFSGRSS